MRNPVFSHIRWLQWTMAVPMVSGNSCFKETTIAASLDAVSKDTVRRVNSFLKANRQVSSLTMLMVSTTCLKSPSVENCSNCWDLETLGVIPSGWEHGQVNLQRWRSMEQLSKNNTSISFLQMNSLLLTLMMVHSLCSMMIGEITSVPCSWI